MVQIQCQACGAQEEIDRVIALEREGRIQEAGERWLAFCPDPEINPWMQRFYERQGMEAPWRRIVDKMPHWAALLQQLDADIETGDPDALATHARYDALFSRWDRAQKAAELFNAQRPWNMTGKNTLILCALQRGDKEAAEAVGREIAAMGTDRPAYQAAQKVWSGEQSWEETHVLWDRNDPYFAQGALATALYYFSRDNADTGRKVIEAALPLCPPMETTGVLMESLLYGSLSRAMAP